MKYSLSSIVALTLIISNTALAADSDFIRQFAYDERRIVVEYHDLDLTSPAHARIFLDRVKRGVGKACERTNLGERVWAGKDRQRCLQETQAASLADIKNRLNIDVERLAANSANNQSNVIASGQ